MDRIRRIIAKSSWTFTVTFGLMLAAFTVAFFALSARPLLSLWRAFVGALITGLAASLYGLPWLIAFEFRLFCFRRIDSRVPLQHGERIVTAELATLPGPLFPRGGALYLTTASLVFVPLRRRFPTIVVPVDKNARCEIAPRSLGAAFQGGLRPRLRVKRVGEEGYVFIVWKPSWWVKTIGEQIAREGSVEGQGPRERSG